MPNWQPLYTPQISLRGFNRTYRKRKIAIHSLQALDKSLPQTSGSSLLESYSASEKSERVEWKVGMEIYDESKKSYFDVQRSQPGCWSHRG